MTLTPADLAAADQAATELAHLLDHLVGQVAAAPDGNTPADPMAMSALAMAVHWKLGEHNCALLAALAIRKLAAAPTTPEKGI